MNIIDLTKPLSNDIEIYKEGSYSDPPFKLTTWCDVETQGFAVSKLEMGTQTGTHIDAPRHFLLEGNTLDKLPISSLIGAYQLIDVIEDEIHYKDTPKHPTFLFLRFHENSILTEENLHELITETPKVWVVCGLIKTNSHDAFALYRALAKSDRYLVENIDENHGLSLKKGGLLFVAPMRLKNVSGAPCRVLAIDAADLSLSNE